jgi:hypothetical protein
MDELMEHAQEMTDFFVWRDNNTPSKSFFEIPPQPQPLPRK